MSCRSAARRRSRRAAGPSPSAVPVETRDLRHALRMAEGVRRLGVDHARECLGDPVQARLVGEDEPLGRLERGDVRPRVRPERGPEAPVLAQGGEDAHELRVEPRPGALEGHVDGGFRPEGGEEDLGRLRQADDAPEERDLLAGQPVGVTLAVPVLVQRADGGGGCFRHVQHAGDLGAPLAADGDHLPGRPGAGPEHADEVALAACVPEGVAERLRQVGVVDRLHVALGDEVVGAEEGGDLGRVRRAARVLEEERVEERRPVVDLEPDLVGEAHSDQARTHGVPCRLALGDVERVGERGEDLGQPQVAAFVHAECIGSRRARPIPRK